MIESCTQVDGVMFISGAQRSRRSSVVVTVASINYVLADENQRHLGARPDLRKPLEFQVWDTP